MIYTRVAYRSTTLFDQRTPLPHTPSPLPPHPSFFDTYALVRAHYRIPREQGGAQHNAAKKREGSDKIWGFRTGVSRTPAGTHAFFARNLPTVRYISSPPPPACVPPLLLLGPTNLPSRKGKRGGVTSFLGHICYSLSIPSILSLFFASRVNEIRKHWVNTLEISVRLINFVGIVRKGDEKREEKKGERKRDARFGGFFGVVGWPTEIRLGYL